MKRDRGIGKILLTPATGLYYIGIKIRHLLYNIGVFSSVLPSIPTVCVGNLTVGGTGKTPHIELLITLIKEHYNVGVLSRGYKRKTKGYCEVEQQSQSEAVGDEPLQIKQKFPDIKVAVNENRVDGINQMVFNDPSLDIILLDDAFQHRKIAAGMNIVLIDYNRPIWEDSMLPTGNLRDTIDQLDRANVVIITKCPENLSPLDKRLLSKKMHLYPYQMLMFSSIAYDEPQPLFKDTDKYQRTKNGIAFAGIAEPTPFIAQIKTLCSNIRQEKFPDHHQFTTKDLERVRKSVAVLGDDTNIFTTEKDAQRLIGMDMPEDLRKRMYVIPIRAKLSDNADRILFNKIDQYVKENTGNCHLHQRAHKQ